MKNLVLSLLLFLALTGLSNGQSFISKTAEDAGGKLRTGDMQGAIAVLTKAIGDNKDLYEAHLMRGNLRSMIGDIDGAIADYTAAIEINPASSDVFEKRAMYRKFRRDYAGALKDLDSAIAHSKRPARIIVARAGLKRDMGNTEGAMVDFQAALAHDPKLASGHIGIADLKEAAGDVDGAILILKDFLDAFEGRHEGKQPTANVNLIGGGSSVKREPKDDKGPEEFIVSTGVVTKRPAGQTPADAEKEAARMEQMLNVAHAYASLGRYYKLKGEDDKALENIEKGLKINPQDAFGYSLRSQIRWKRNDLAGVIADMTKLVSLPMSSPGIHHDKAMLLTLQGRDAEAAAEFALHQKTFPAYTDEKMRADIEKARQLRERKKP